MNCYFCNQYIKVFKFKYCQSCNVEYYKHHANIRIKRSIPCNYNGAKPYIQF